MVILASASPRRQELLSLVVEDYICIPADMEEETDFSLAPGEIVMDLAKQKADFVFKNNGGVVIGCDTLVFVDGKHLGKPANKDEAKEMLTKLSGVCHSVYTGVCIKSEDKTALFFEKTDLEFIDISDEMMENYVTMDDPYDKAGAYGVQGHASNFIKSVYGNYHNVLGLPIYRLNAELKKFGIKTVI